MKKSNEIEKKSKNKNVQLKQAKKKMLAANKNIFCWRKFLLKTNQYNKNIIGKKNANSILLKSIIYFLGNYNKFKEKNYGVFSKLSCQVFISMPKAFLILLLSKTLKLGRLAGVGNCVDGIGFKSIETLFFLKIADAKSYQEH